MNDVLKQEKDLNDVNPNRYVDNHGVNKLLRRQKGLNKARRLLRIYRARFPRNRDLYVPGSEAEHHLLNTRVPCSCPMCGNPRRYRDQRTIQEIKSDAELLLNFDVFS